MIYNISTILMFSPGIVIIGGLLGFAIYMEVKTRKNLFKTIRSRKRIIKIPQNDNCSVPQTYYPNSTKQVTPQILDQCAIMDPNGNIISNTIGETGFESWYKFLLKENNCRVIPNYKHVIEDFMKNKTKSGYQTVLVSVKDKIIFGEIVEK